MPMQHFKRLDKWYEEKNGFNGYAYDFSTDYNAIAVSDILDIHKYLMKKNEIV